MGMRIEPEISGVQVVLVGDFNPAIFTPAWFALYRLLIWKGHLSRLGFRCPE